MKAIILAGGLGSRLRERVPDLPKPMALVAGRPFLEYILDQLIMGGVSDIVLSVGYRADSIIDHFGNTYRDVALNYVIENEPLGTGGAIKHALGEVNNEPVFVLNGDTFLEIDYKELSHWYQQLPTLVAMVLKKVPDVTRYGSVKVKDNRVCGFLEKGKSGAGLINAGVYVLDSGVFNSFSISGAFSYEMDFLQKYCDELLPRAFITDAFFIDIGVPEDYERAQDEIPSLLL